MTGDYDITEPIYIIHGRSVSIMQGTLDEAKREGWYDRNSDDGWFDYIEVVQPDGTSIKLDDGDIPEFQVWDDERYQEYSDQAKERPHVASLRLDDRDTISSFYGDDGVHEADKMLGSLAPWLGDRVTIKLTDAGKRIANP